MAQERFIPFLPQTRQIEKEQFVKDVLAPPLQMPAPSEEEARAVDQVFATQPEEHNALMDGLTFAAAGILLNDIVKDTLAEPTDEEEDKPKLKPKEPEDGEK
jgi:hypothetical protein